MRIVLLYEHPTWSNDLLARARERELNITPFDVGAGQPLPLAGGFDLWVNRVNAMPSGARPASIVAATGHLLLQLELAGQRVVNGSQTHRIGGSKAAQTSLFSHLGLQAPASVSIFQPADALDAAEATGYPVLTKPNVGGSGAGVMRHDTAEDLQRAIDEHTVDLGVDGTGLVQQVIESADGLIYRVEMLGDELFYGTQQQLQADSFNYCAADGCAVEAGPDAIALFLPPESVIDAASRVMRSADTAVGGVEYIIDRSSGEPSFFDFNPYSNFVAGRNDELGFDPIDRYLDFVLSY